MRLSLVFELLLIFVLLAFAASKSVKKQNQRKSIQNRNDEDKPDDDGINKYCKCSEAFCNCCRDFSVPVINLNGPGCATLMYLNGDKMSVSLSFGKKVITNRTLSSRKPSPVCMPLPGGISKFCGRVYNIARAGEEFRACLGLELQAKSTVEAAVRVSCFKFGPRGVTSEPADPLPLVPQDEKEDDDDDDDDDDDFGLSADDDDEEEDDDDDDDEGELDAVNDVESADYTGFSLLGEDILGDLFGSSGGKKPNKIKKKQAPAVTSTTSTTTRRPRPSRRPSRRPTRTTTPLPIRSTTVRVRPVNGNRRTTRRPTRRPGNGGRPQRRTTTESTSTSISTTTTSAPIAIASDIPVVQTTENIAIISSINTEKYEPVAIIDQKAEPTMKITTPNSVTEFIQDPSLEMSLAHITGQLSSMQVTPLQPNNEKESNLPKIESDMKYEKVETLTPKTPSTVAFDVTPGEAVSDDMIQIVQSLDSSSEEISPTKESITADESRGHFYNFGSHYEGLTLPKKKNRNPQFALEDLDVLDLTEIGENIGDQFGIFGGKKRQNKLKPNKHRDGRDDDEYDEMFDVISLDALTRKSDTGNKDIKKDRRRQNKMMRDLWPEA
ncbi:eisosome protein SEG2 [Bombyx mandarina]|uniref:Eisosome protein SEG2 n=1 Tax=Bombyx mandarina TaxID=7092 RepID=A0A6J2JFI5_BOMMA|nr:eisosome protein SEG2 [Bombyx mandarina]